MSPNRHKLDEMCVCGQTWGKHIGTRCPGAVAARVGEFTPLPFHRTPAHESLEMDPLELEFRRGLWVNHGCPIATLYGDDGELQCNRHHCRHDFLREPLVELLTDLIAEGRLHIGKVQA